MSPRRTLVLAAIAALCGCERRHPPPHPQPPPPMPRVVVETGAKRDTGGTTTLTNADLPASSADAGAPRTDRLTVVQSSDVAKNLGIVAADGGPVAPAPATPPAPPAPAPEPGPAGAPPPSAADAVPWSGSGTR